MDTTVAFATGAYVAFLLLMGVVGRRSMRQQSLSEFYLAGRTIGFAVLLLTLFATQYSGNSLSGFPGKTYRAGLSYIMSVTFMVGIISGFLPIVPQLFARARRKRFLTPTDYLADRFASPALNYLSATIFAVTLCNFLLAQLIAMGHAFSGLTEGRIPHWAGVVGGAVVILIYECLGGMRAVAWTDAMQGMVLLLGLLMVVVLIMVEIGTPAAIVHTVHQIAPEKIDNPGLKTCITWLSSFLLLGLGAPLYPQAIQRIYAARQLTELRRALAVMAVIPLFAITTVVFIGLTGAAVFPDLGAVESDRVTFKVLAHLVDIQPLAAVPVIMVMMAVLAAIMSTADSALLSLSSIFTKDFAGRLRGLKDAEVEKLARLGPFFSAFVLLVFGLVAVQPQLTLWRLLEIKFEILIQLSPAFILGTLHQGGEDRAYNAGDILSGLLTGLAVALGLWAAGVKSIHGLHPGVLGVLINYAVVIGSRAIRIGKANPEVTAATLELRSPTSFDDDRRV
ncbi:MAG: sodium:solute symporter family protein [Acidobacteriota bacterium]